MDLVVRREGAVPVLELQSRRLDAEAAPEFRAALMAQVEAGERRLVINLRSVAFIDSSGLAALLAGIRSLADQGELRICGPQPAVRSILELTRVSSIVAIFETEEAALRGFAT